MVAKIHPFNPNFNPNFDVEAASGPIRDEDVTDLVVLLAKIEGNGVTGNSMHKELQQYLPALRRSIASLGYRRVKEGDNYAL